jgi:PAS domain S-box-containing protein
MDRLFGCAKSRHFVLPALVIRTELLPMLDWHQVVDSSTLRFGGQTVWEIYEWQILAVLALCVLEAGLILSLLLVLGRRARAENAQRLLEEKYAKAFRSSPDAILLTRRSDGKILEANDRWKSLVGYSQDETPGPTAQDLNLYVNVEDREKLVNRLEREGIVQDFETKLRLRNGVIRRITISGESITINNEACVLAIIRDVTDRKESEETLQKLTSALIHSQEEERGRIAAELHDSVGQGLMIIKNRVLICLRNTADREKVNEQLEELLSTATATIEEARAIAHNLRPYELDTLGLTNAVKALLDIISRSTPLLLSSDLDSIDGLLPRDAESGIYRIVQEGLTNVLKHAHATEARVAIKRVGAQVIVRVTDNGNGNGNGNGSGNHADKKAPNRAGFGLTGIAHRARMLGGAYDFHSRSEGGSVLQVTAKIGEGDHEPQNRNRHS